MLDEHIVPKNWGLIPYINFIGLHIPTYTIFMILAFLSAFICFKLTADKKSEDDSESRKIIIAFALLGGIIGSKLPILITNYHLLFKYPDNLILLFYGKTIVGGLIGGVIAVAFIKRKLKINIRTGNDIAAPAALGMAIGRIGCLFTGCCYGIKCSQALGINFGDGFRYPTQIYEMIFDFVLFVVLLYLKRTKELKPGALFKYLLNSYFIFRILIEFIRANERVFFVFTYYQLLCAFCLLFINRKVILEFIKKFKKAGN